MIQSSHKNHAELKESIQKLTKAVFLMIYDVMQELYVHPEATPGILEQMIVYVTDNYIWSHRPANQTELDKQVRYASVWTIANNFYGIFENQNDLNRSPWVGIPVCEIE